MLVLAGPEPERRDCDRSRAQRAGRHGEADLRGAERDSRGRPNGDTGDLPRRGVDAGRHVDGDDRPRGGIDQVDHPRRVLAWRALEPDSEQRVDDDVRVAQVADTVDHGHLPPGVAQHAGADLPVTAVLPLAADDRHAARKAMQDELRDGCSGTLHQIVQ